MSWRGFVFLVVVFALAMGLREVGVFRWYHDFWYGR